MGIKRAKKKRASLRAGLAEALSFPACTVSGVPYLELQGDASLCITGYEGLLLYEDTNILFRMRDPTAPHFTHLRVTGGNLQLCVVRDGCLRITGRIDAVILHPHDVAMA